MSKLCRTLTKIINNNGEEFTTQTEILSEIRDFYSNLYNSQDQTLDDINLNDLLRDYDIPKLSDDDRDRIEGQISYKEASQSLKKMRNDKSPGPDGFTVEFFKCFLE